MPLRLALWWPQAWTLDRISSSCRGAVFLALQGRETGLGQPL